MKTLLLISAAFLFSSCTSLKIEDAYVGKLNIFQPSVLSLEAGTEVDTKAGIYKAQTDEVWHSDKRFRELERQVFGD
jgi:hypothetical protein